MVEAVEEDHETPDESRARRERWEAKWWGDRKWSGTPDDIVSVGSDSHLEKGRHANSVVSVFGSSTSEGDVSDAVVSVLGDTRASGTVGDAVVSVLGDNYVNAKVYGDVVAVMGNIELGPEADVGGQVVVVGGNLKRDPAAVVHGGVQRVLGPTFGSFHWLRPWIKHCMLLGRPLAFADGLGWAWGLALGFLALYAFIAFLFRDAVDRCITVLETRPGQTFVAALLGLLLTPVMFALLFFTIIGIAVVPFAGVGLFIATVFGKVVVLAWIGRRVSKMAGEGASLHTAALVVIGGVIVLVLYLVPVIGFVVYKALGILGFGVAMYAVILALKARRGESGTPRAPTTPPPEPLGGEPYIGAGTAAFAGGPDASMASSTDSTASAFGSTTAGYTSEDPLAGGAGSGATATSAADLGAAEGSASAGSAYGGAASGGSTYGGGPSAARPAAATASPPPSTLPRAEFMVRMGALLIDVILISVLLHVISNSHDAQLLVLAAYGAIMWKLKGTTIGGIVFGLQVVRADGRPIDWSTAVVRALACFLSLVVVGLGFIWIAFDDQRQGWHDKIAGTLVVRVPKGVSLL